MTAFPVSIFLLMPGVLLNYLGGATILYWIFPHVLALHLCISAPMAWHITTPTDWGKPSGTRHRTIILAIIAAAVIYLLLKRQKERQKDARRACPSTPCAGCAG